MKISAVILTKNEEKNIKESILGLSFADEIIIIDDFSTDTTIAVIDEFKDERIKIYQRALSDDFSSQRNFASSKSRNRYVFFLDADERVDKSLEDEISLLDENFDGYMFKRLDNIWGKTLEHGETGNIYLMRLANKETGKWIGKVHERWDIKGNTRKLRNPLMHFPHQNISEFLKEINYYTDLRSKELYEKKIKSGFLQIIIYTKAKFFINYFIKQGFRDGIQGFLMAILMSFHSFMVRGKLWLLWQRNS